MNGPATPRRTWADGRIAALLVVVAAVLAFAPSLGGSFVWDDHRFIDENPAVTAPASWLAFFTDAGTADTIGARGIVRPMRTFEFALDWAAFGRSAPAFRLHSLAWHVAGSLLLLAIARRLLGDGRAALAAAVFWAVHPVQAESVAFVSSRGDVAMGACSLAAVLLALASDGRDRLLALSLVAAAFAPLYKETAVALPLVIAALRWTKRTRVPVWPYVVVAALYVVYRQGVSTGAMDEGRGPVLGGSFTGTVATMSRAGGFYLAEVLLPAQSLDWYMTPSASFADAAVLAWMAVHVSLLASAVAFRTRAPVWTIAVAWFAAFLVPVANWPFSLGIPTTERFLYLPLAGAALALGWAVVRGPRGVGAAAAVAVVALGAASAERSAMWRSDEVLWAAVEADHDSPRVFERAARLARGRALELRADALRRTPGPDRADATRRATAAFEESLAHAHRAIFLWTQFERNDRPVGQLAQRPEVTASNVCYILGRDEEALFHAEEAIRIDERYGIPDARAHYDRAMPLVQLGYAPQAVESMNRALELGLASPTEELGQFFVQAAEACLRAELPATARAAFDAAVRASPDGPLRRAAEKGRDAVRGHAVPDDVERARLAALDKTLARVPRTCPAPRAHGDAR